MKTTTDRIGSKTCFHFNLLVEKSPSTTTAAWLALQAFQFLTPELAGAGRHFISSPAASAAAGGGGFSPGFGHRLLCNIRSPAATDDTSSRTRDRWIMHGRTYVPMAHAGRPADERSGVLALRRGSRGGVRAMHLRTCSQDGRQPTNGPASSAAVDHAQAFGGSNKRYRLRSCSRTPVAGANSSGPARLLLNILHVY